MRVASNPLTPSTTMTLTERRTQITPDGKRDAMASKKPDKGRADSEDNPQESFFNLLTRCQSARMEDQRATLHSNKENRMKEAAKRAAAGGQDNSWVLSCHFQGFRGNDQFILFLVVHTAD